MTQINNYKPLKWLDKFNEKHDIIDSYFYNKIENIDEYENNGYYSCMSYIFKILSDNVENDILEKMNTIFELLNSIKIQHKFENNIHSEIKRNHLNYNGIIKNVHDIKLFQYNLHFNIMIFTYLIDFILLLKSNKSKHINDFLNIIIMTLNNKNKLSNEIKTVYFGNLII